ncbi:MAG: hypothetical protein AAB289_12055, partial [Chloroflexota bacterium]
MNRRLALDRPVLMKVLPILRRAWPLFVVFLLMLATLGYPMSWDQGVYAYVGQGILQGHPPYRDAWAQNAPGNFFAYAAALRLFGATAWSIGMLGLMEVVAGAGAVMLAAHQLLGFRYVAAAGLSFGITMALWGGYWDRAHPESLMAIGVTLVVVAVTTAQRKPRWALPAWAFAGFLTGCCVVLKPTGAVGGVLALGMPLVLTRGRAAPPRAGWLVAFGLGALAPIAAVAAYLNLTGSMEYFREQVLEYNLHYVGAGFGQDLFASITSLTNQTVLLAGPVPVLAAMGARMAWTRQAGDPAVRLLFLWAGLTYLGVAVQSSHYGYHQYFTLPAFSLLAALAIVHWRNFVPRRRSLLYLACLATALYAGFEAAVAGPRLRTFGAGLSESFGVPVEGDFLGRQGLETRQRVG